MTTSSTPQAWLDAVAAAAVWCEPAAFNDAIVELPPGDDHPLAVACIDRMRRHARGRSIAELRLTREDAWCDQSGALTPVASLVRFGKRWLCWDRERGVALAGSLAEPRHERAAQFRWACLALPWDLLSAAVAAADAPNGALPVRLHRPMRLASRPEALRIAETHLHIAASFEYGQVWVGLMLAAYSGKLDLRSLPEDRAVPFGDIRALRARLYEAALLRIALAQELEVGANRRDATSATDARSDTFSRTLPSSGGPGWIEAALRPVTDRHDKEVLLSIERAWLRPKDTRANIDRWSARTRLLLVRAVSRIRARYIGRSGVGQSTIGRLARSLAEVADNDPIGAYGFGADSPVDHWEHAFQVRLLRRLLLAERHSGPFEVIALQYLRAFAWIYRFVVQEPGISGLDWFRRHYARVEALTAPLESLSYRDIALRDHASHASAARSHELVAVEARTTPKRRWPDVWKKVQRTSAGAGEEGSGSVEMGLVLHFIRDEVAENSRGQSGAWYARWHAVRLREAIAVASLIRMQPGVLQTLRGVDAANHELAVPTWTQLPLFDRILDAVAKVPGVLSVNGHRFGITSHVGEDFRTLHEGLRRIDEVLAYYETRRERRDSLSFRLGHALALGTSPRLWAARRGIVLQPKIERIWDLIWELELSHDARVQLSPSRRRHHIEQAASYATEIGLTTRLGLQPNSPSIDVAARLVKLRLRLHDPRWLRLTGYPVVAKAHSTDASVIGDLSILERGRRPVRVVVDDEEVRALEALQACVHQRAAGINVTVEANPSSNLLVGDLGALRNHPILALAPVGRTSGGLRVSINSDDPLTFATSTGEEYAYMRAALESAGFPSADVASWIFERAADGLNSRFTTATRD